jgi:hypothetical protein
MASHAGSHFYWGARARLPGLAWLRLLSIRSIPCFKIDTWAPVSFGES